MSNNSSRIGKEVLNRFSKDPIPCVLDLSKFMPMGTLSKEEFAVSIRNKWIKNVERKYYFTKTFQDCVLALRNEQNVRAKPREAEAPGRETYSDKSLAVDPIGANQVKVLEIIYRGTNKLGHPQIRLNGIDGEGKVRTIERGIPLEVAQVFKSKPNTFNGKVVSVDHKDNYIGIVLAHSYTKDTEGPDI